MKIRVTKGKWKGTQGKVVGVYMDGRYDIKVSLLNGQAAICNPQKCLGNTQ
jgi:ribosomal protein L24